MTSRSRGFFDPQRRRAEPDAAPDGEAPRALSVSELTRQVKNLLEHGFERLWVEGEISNFRRYASGHCYLTLKDATAQLPCVIWRGVAEIMRFNPSDGQKVLTRGRLSVYEPRGQYQLVVERMEPAGAGALAAAFEALKAKLAAEGLFAAERKRPLPPYPRRIALVTSPSGAALRDLLKVIRGRWPGMELILAPVRVQGEGAAREIAAAIADLNRLRCADVMIVGRGGGSLEDLWAFNEEVVARAIAASEIPVISAVGHEIDFTIADFVADVRAATPSHAGELVVQEYRAVLEHLARLRRALPEALLQRVALARERLRSLREHWALRRPEERLQAQRQRLDDLQGRLAPLLRRLLALRQERLAGLAGRLEGLSPLKVLDRGYSVTTRERDGRVVRSGEDVREGETIVSRLARGRLVSRLERREGPENV